MTPNILRVLAVIVLLLSIVGAACAREKGANYTWSLIFRSQKNRLPAWDLDAGRRKNKVCQHKRIVDELTERMPSCDRRNEGD